VCGLLAICVAHLPAQQLRWQLPASAPSLTRYHWMASFVDFNQDGSIDYLRLVTVTPNPGQLEIASGLDGATLWVQSPYYTYTGAIACYAGDMDGDGTPDIAYIRGHASGVFAMVVYSPSRGVDLWIALGSQSAEYGDSLLGDIDVTGDGRPDLLTTTFSYASADVYVYDNDGTLLYQVPCSTLGRRPASLCKMGDLDGDGCDDFVVGCLDGMNGMQVVVSGKTGSTIRETYGLQLGDQSAAHVSNVGDIDGDGVADYAVFPWYTSQRNIAVAYSGATGAVIRSWYDRGNSVVTGEDFDQDGVNDIVTGADWILPGVTGRTYCYSGRDGSELWRVDAVPFPTGFNGQNWMDSSASLGTQPGSPYPVVAWLGTQWYDATIGGQGRIVAYGGARAGQGPVTGTACTSSSSLPLIGVRKLGVGAANTGFRTTVAKTHGNALAALNFAFGALPTPVDLTPFGFAGCTVYVDPAATFLQVTGTTGLDRGYAAVDLPHPLSAAATGTDVVAQWLVLDPATAAFAATQMHAIRLP